MSKISQFVNESSVDLNTKFDKLTHTYGEILDLLYDNDEELVELLKDNQIIGVCFNFENKFQSIFRFKSKILEMAKDMHLMFIKQK